MFLPDKPFQHCLIFEGKAGAYPSALAAPIDGRLIASVTNIRLGWKGLHRSLSRKYVNYSCKKLGDYVIKFLLCQIKLERLSPINPFQPN